MATAFTQTMLNAMSQAINKLNADIAAGASSTTLISDVVAYYNLQTSVRGYASEAAEVAANINYNGNVANQNVENYVNSVGGNWAATQVTLATSLAIADWNTINANQGMIPTLYYLDQEHINVFSAIPIAGTNLTGIPITYWSGTPFAYENQNWLGTVATSSELSGASQASLFSQESTSQIAASFFQLLYAVGQAEVNFDDVQDWTSLQEAMADQVVAVNFLNYVAANDPALASALLGGAVTMGKNGLSGFIKISETQLQQTLYPQQSAQLVPISLTLNEDSSGNFQSLTTDNNGGTSTVTTYLANGLLSSAPFAVQDDYSSADGTGSLVQTVITFVSGGTETIMNNGAGVLPTYSASGGASIATTYTVAAGGATLAQISSELGIDPTVLRAINPTLGATATLASGTAINLDATTSGTGLPSSKVVDGTDLQHTMLYNLDTNRYYAFAVPSGGSTAGLFEIVDDSGDVLYSAAASGVTGITESLATSFDPAVIQVTAGGQTSQIAAGTHYDVQPGDTWTLLAPELSAASGNSMDTDLLESVNGGLSAAPVVGTDLRIPAVTFESFQTQPDVASSIYEGGSNPNLDLVLDVNSMSQSYTAALPGGTDGNRILVIDDAGHLLATAPLTDNFTVNYDINDGGPTSLVLAGVTYTPGTGNGTVAQTAGGDTVSGAVTVDPSTTGSGVTVADSAGSGTVTFDDAASGTGDPDFWTVGSGTDTATLQAGTAVVDFTGGQSQYAVSYTASSQTLAVTDGVAGRNGAKTLTAAGGSAKLFFALNQPGESELELGTQVEGDDATTKGALFSEGALMPVTVDGQLTDELTDTAAGSAYIIGATSGETDDIANGSTASNAPSGTIAFADEPMPVTESHSQLWLTKSANGRRPADRRAGHDRAGGRGQLVHQRRRVRPGRHHPRQRRHAGERAGRGAGQRHGGSTSWRIALGCTYASTRVQLSRLP